MKIEILPIKKLLPFLFLCFFYQLSYSQCATGDAVQDFCAIDNPIISDIVVSGISVVWFDASTGGTQHNTTDILVDGVTYYALDTDASCTDPIRLPVTINIYGEPPANTDVFVGKCAGDNATVGDLSAIGTNIEWYDAQTGGSQFNLIDPLVDGTTYWVQQTENGCTSLRLPTLVTIVDPPPPTVVQDQSFCFPPNPTVADLQASEPSILWYATETSSTPLNTTDLLIDGEDYWATQNIFPCESTIRVVVIVTLDPAPDAGTDGSLSLCEIETTPQNLFDQLGGTPDTTGIWTGPSTLSGGYLGTFDPTINAEGNYIYTVSSTGTTGICPDVMATVSVTIIVIPPPTTTETTQTFCSIDFAPASPTIADLAATGAGTIQWYDTETDTTPLNSTDVLIDGEDYWATDTDIATGCESASRLVVTVSLIDPLPPTTTDTTQTFCLIDFDPNPPTVADLVATGTGTIQWYDTETDTTPLNSTDVLIDGEDYWATDTDTATGCESPTRLVITVSLIDPLPPTTTDTTQTFCMVSFLPDGPTVADLIATGTGTIQWYDTETDTTPLNNTDLLVDGEDYWASDTDIASGCESSTRLVVTVSIIDPLPPTTTETTQTFCSIDFVPGNPTVADLVATGTGTIQWYDTETDTTPLNSTDVLIDGQDYWATDTDIASGCESSTRLVVTVNIIDPLPPTTTDTTQNFCLVDFAPGVPTVADLVATGIGTIQWYDTETDTTPLNSTDVLIDGEDYWATDTDTTTGCESPTRLVVTVSLTDPLPPTTTETTQAFCIIDFPPNGPTIGDLIASGTGTIQWYDTETDTTPLNNTDLLVDGEDYWATDTNTATGCESSTRLVVTVVLNNPPPPTTTETEQTFCIEDFFPSGPTIADIIVTGTTIVWYDTETSTTPLNSTDLLVDGEDYWAAENDTATGCESSTRLVVTVNVVNPPPPTISETDQSFCVADNPTIANIDASGTDVQWYDTETSTTPLDSADALIDGEDYWATTVDGTSGCESIPRVVVNITINDVLPPTTSETTQTFCASDAPTLADLNITGTAIVWYDSESSTASLSPSDALVDGEDYWAADSDATTGCESSIRIVITVGLTDPGTPSINSQDTVFCELDDSNATIGDLNNSLTTNGGTITWYDNYPNGNILSLDELVSDNATYYAVETDSDGCSSVTPLAVTVTFYCDPQLYDIEIFDGFSPNNDGRNDRFVIKDIRVLYPDFRIEILNRWGNTVFNGSASTSDWNGLLNGSGKEVTVGVYYFILHFNKDNRKPIQGRLYLSR